MHELESAIAAHPEVASRPGASSIARAVMTLVAPALARAWAEGRASAMDDAHNCDGFDERPNPHGELASTQ